MARLGNLQPVHEARPDRQPHHLVPSGPGRTRTINAIALHRALEDPCFTPREVRLVHLFHLDLGRLLGSKLATVNGQKQRTDDIPDEVDLPPRLRQVLACLMEGNSEKQVALRLGISPHTVHTYINRLHLRFNVQSRGELLARFIPRMQQNSPM